jgi:hypothetical protein
MIRQVLSSIFFALGVGFICQLTQEWLASNYLNEFLKSNLINLLVALLAINTATMGIVLTKVRDLVDSYGNGEAFKKTRQQMLLSIKEQIMLIIFAIILLTISESHVLINSISRFDLLIKSLISGIFVYSMRVLYDVATSVLIIIDFDVDGE